MTLFLSSATRPRFNVWLLAQSNLVGLAAIVATAVGRLHKPGAGLRVVFQPVRDIAVARHRHRHRVFDDGRARHRRHEPCDRLDRRLRRHVGRLSDAGAGLARSHSRLRRGWCWGRCSAGQMDSPLSAPGVNSFIMTLASASLYVGGMLILTKADIYNEVPPEIAAFGRMRLGFVSPLLLIALADRGVACRAFSLHRARTRNPGRRRQRARRRAIGHACRAA